MHIDRGEIENFSTCGDISDVSTWQMWRNLKFSTYGMCVGWAEKKNVCDVENVAIYAKFIAFYAVLLQNMLFTLFCRKISCGEKLSPKEHLWRKNDKYQVWHQIDLFSPSRTGKSHWHCWQKTPGKPNPFRCCLSLGKQHWSKILDTLQFCWYCSACFLFDSWVLFNKKPVMMRQESF